MRGYTDGLLRDAREGLVGGQAYAETARTTIEKIKSDPFTKNSDTLNSARELVARLQGLADKLGIYGSGEASNGKDAPARGGIFGALEDETERTFQILGRGHELIDEINSRLP